MSDRYQSISYHQQLWHVPANANFSAIGDDVDALYTSQSSLNALVTNWAVVENIMLAIATAPTYSDADTFTLPGNWTDYFGVNKLVVGYCGTDGVKASTVLSSSYGAGVTTINLNDAVLTANLERVSVEAVRDGLWPHGTGVVNALDYKQAGYTGRETLEDAIAAIGVLNRILTVAPDPDGDWEIDDDLEFPQNVTPKILRGAVLEVADTKSLTFNAAIDAGPYHWLTLVGSATVTMENQAEAWLNWLCDGGIGTSGNPWASFDDTAGISSLLDAGVGKLRMVEGYYLVEPFSKSSVNNFCLSGAGRGRSYLTYTASTGDVIDLDCLGVYLDNFSILGPGTTGDEVALNFQTPPDSGYHYFDNLGADDVGGSVITTKAFIVRLENSVLHNSGGNLLHFVNSGGFLSVEGCYLTTAGTHGIEMGGSLIEGKASHTDGSPTIHLIKANYNFSAAGASIGNTVYNLTQNATGTISGFLNHTGTNDLVVHSALSGCKSWAVGDVFTIADVSGGLTHVSVSNSNIESCELWGIYSANSGAYVLNLDQVHFEYNGTIEPGLVGGILGDVRIGTYTKSMTARACRFGSSITGTATHIDGSPTLHLIKSGYDFAAAGVKAGHKVFNIVGGVIIATATVSSVTDYTPGGNDMVVHDALTGGNSWAVGETFYISVGGIPIYAAGAAYNHLVLDSNTFNGGDLDNVIDTGSGIGSIAFLGNNISPRGVSFNETMIDNGATSTPLTFVKNLPISSSGDITPRHVRATGSIEHGLDKFKSFAVYKAVPNNTAQNFMTITAASALSVSGIATVSAKSNSGEHATHIYAFKAMQAVSPAVLTELGTGYNSLAAITLSGTVAGNTLTLTATTDANWAATAAVTVSVIITAPTGITIVEV